MTGRDGDGQILTEARALFDALRWRRCRERLAEADAKRVRRKT